MSDKENPKKEREEYLLIYETTLENVKSSMNRQWAVAYYGLFGLAGIISFIGIIRKDVDLSQAQKILTAIPVLVLNWVCFDIFIDIHSNLCMLQKTLVVIRDRFEEFAKQLLKSGPTYVRIDSRHFPFPGLFCFVITTGTFFVAWILYGEDLYCLLNSSDLPTWVLFWEDIHLLYLALSICVLEFILYSYYYCKHEARLKSFEYKLRLCGLLPEEPDDKKGIIIRIARSLCPVWQKLTKT